MTPSTGVAWYLLTGGGARAASSSRQPPALEPRALIFLRAHSGATQVCSCWAAAWCIGRRTGGRAGPLRLSLRCRVWHAAIGSAEASAEGAISSWPGIDSAGPGGRPVRQARAGCRLLFPQLTHRGHAYGAPRGIGSDDRSKLHVTEIRFHPEGRCTSLPPTTATTRTPAGPCAA